MPIIEDSYRPSLLHKNGHLSTVIPYFTKRSRIQYERERLETEDEDFIDIDWLRVGGKHLIILCHGLEGDSGSHYMLSMAQFLSNENWDVVCMNYRGCSGEINRKLQMYHSGSTPDIRFVVEKIGQKYTKIALVGFSLGGNMVLKYASEMTGLSHQVATIIAISAPCHLSASSHNFTKASNYFYEKRFMLSLKKKLRQKAKLFPDSIDLSALGQVQSILAFDDKYTAPIHGFIDAEDYYLKCSSIFKLHLIQIPSLLISAIDDPFLHPLCFPVEEAKSNENLYLLLTKYGGHVGFTQKARSINFAEEKTIAFLKQMGF